MSTGRILGLPVSLYPGHLSGKCPCCLWGLEREGWGMGRRTLVSDVGNHWHRTRAASVKGVVLLSHIILGWLQDKPAREGPETSLAWRIWPIAQVQANKEMRPGKPTEPQRSEWRWCPRWAGPRVHEGRQVARAVRMSQELWVLRRQLSSGAVSFLHVSTQVPSRLSRVTSAENKVE